MNLSKFNAIRTSYRSILLLCFISCPQLFAADNSLQRLFLSPSMRDNIDQVRIAPPKKNIAKIISREEKEIIQQAEITNVRLKGILIKNNGDHSIWVNDDTISNTELSKHSLTIGINNISGDKVPVTLPDGRKITLRPGQIFKSTSNTIIEAYQETTTVPPIQVKTTSDSSTKTAKTEIKSTNNPQNANESLEIKTGVIESLTNILKTQAQLDDIISKELPKVEP